MKIELVLLQEDGDSDCEENGLKKYPFWWYKEDYEIFIRDNLNYIYKENLKIFEEFLEHDID